MGEGGRSPILHVKQVKRLACKMYLAGSVTHFWPEVWLNFAAWLYVDTYFHCTFSQYGRFYRQGSIWTDPDDANILSPVLCTTPSSGIVVGHNCQDTRFVAPLKRATPWGCLTRWWQSLYAHLRCIPVDRGFVKDLVLSMERFWHMCNCGGSAEGW